MIFIIKTLEMRMEIKLNRILQVISRLRTIVILIS